MECYDPNTEEWTFMSEMEKARSGLAMATIDQNIFAFGGRYRHTDQYYDLVERLVVHLLFFFEYLFSTGSIPCQRGLYLRLCIFCKL